MHRKILAIAGLGVLVGSTLVLCPGGPASAAASDDCSNSTGGMVPNDVNGDGRTDVAIADPAASIDGHRGAGAVQVRYGGPKAPAATRLTQNNSGGTAEKNDHFGASVAMARVDGDECTDLVIGVPGENLSGKADAGVVHVIFGSPLGAGKGRPSLVLRPGSLGQPGAAQANAKFGTAVAAPPSEDGGGRVLAIGAPGATSGAGAVWVLTVATDATVSAAHSINEATAGVPGAPRAGDRFGAALDFGYLFKGSRGGYGADLLVGAPGEKKGAGAAVLIADAGAPAPYTGTYFTQATPGVGDTPEQGDAFGAALDVYLNGITGAKYVVIGAPGEDLAGHKDAGLAHLFAVNTKMRGSDETTISQNTKGVADQAEAGDRFGASVHLTDYWTGGGTSFGVAIGAPGEDVGGVRNAGGVAFFPFYTGSPGAKDRWVTQNTPGVPGTAQQGDHFGAALGRSPLGGLVVGVPDDADHASGAVQHIPWEVLLGQSTKGAKTWAFKGGSRFGATIG